MSDRVCPSFCPVQSKARGSSAICFCTRDEPLCQQGGGNGSHPDAKGVSMGTGRFAWPHCKAGAAPCFFFFIALLLVGLNTTPALPCLLPTAHATLAVCPCPLPPCPCRKRHWCSPTGHGSAGETVRNSTERMVGGRAGRNRDKPESHRLATGRVCLN